MCEKLIVQPNTFIGLYAPQQRNIKKSIEQYNVAELISIVGRALDVPVGYNTFKSRVKALAEARTIAVGLISVNMPELSQTKIAELFNRDRTTILHMQQLFQDLNKRDKEFTEKVQLVLNFI